MADIQQKEGETLQQSMSRLGADNPDLQWMQDLASRDDVAWQRVQEIHDTWEYEHESISPAAALIISIAVGMALPAGGLLAGEGIGATVANAGLNQLATQASISLVNNGGDIGAVLKELGSNESIKGLVTASVTAGLGEGILKPGFNSNVSWQSNLGNELYNAGIYATVDTAVHGGSLQDNLEQRLTSALVDWSSKTVTNSIGDTSGAESIITESSWEEGGWQKTLAHALVGCASASAKSQDCGSAATASAVAEIMSPWLSENGFDDQADAIILDVTNIAVASLAKQDVDVAVESGRRVEKYNRQLHYEEAQALRSLIENNPDESEKLRASACLQIKCAEGVSENDPKYPELQKLQELGEILKASNDEAYVAFDMAAKESGLFEYKLIDYANDFITSNEQSVSRALGALQAGSATIGTIGGGAITITSTAACVTTIAGCVVTVGGAALTAAESYRLYQGLERALGGHTYTSGQRVLDSFSPDTHQGEFDPLSVAAQEAGIALVEVGAGKFAIKVADKIHDVSAVDFGKVGGDSAGPDKLPDFDLSKVDPPKGKSYDGTVHRYEKPEYVETTWDQHQGNIDASHRYTGEGQGGVYAGTSQQTALDEIKYYDINAEDLRVPVNQDVKLDNVLDLTDQSVRDRIGVDLDDITNSTDYTKTQQIGNWAKKNGYDGILAPSARNPEGSNIVILKND